MLGAVRIRRMVERLQLSQRTRDDVYSLFQRILNERTHLFFNRHIDQIMLCCFYRVAQVSPLTLETWECIVLHLPFSHSILFFFCSLQNWTWVSGRFYTATNSNQSADHPFFVVYLLIAHWQAIMMTSNRSMLELLHFTMTYSLDLYGHWWWNLSPMKKLWKVTN
jgi:hypothetical protein